MIPAKKMIAHVILAVLLFFEGLSKREHCQRNRVYVEDITQHSAVLYWKATHVSESKDYKVLCAGVRQYITVEGDRELDLDTVTQFVPQGIGQTSLNKLQPNFNYSCTVQTLTEGHSEQETRPLLFSTLYSIPEEPTAPVIVLGDGSKQIDIQLFPASTKYGPIDGYEVQFHILDEDTPHIHGRPDLPTELTQPRGLLASMEAAHSSTQPMPFCIVFRNQSLPSHMRVSDSFLQGALRSGPTYIVVTAAYTDNYEEISNPLLYALSQPSKPFSLAVTADQPPQSESSHDTLPWLERQLLTLSMAVGVVSSNAILLYFLVVGCCLLRIRTADQQDNVYQANVNSESRGRRTNETEVLLFDSSAPKEQLSASGDLSAGSVGVVGNGASLESVECSVGSPDPGLPVPPSLPASPALTTTGIGSELCSLQQAETTEQPVDITPMSSVGTSVGLPADDKLAHAVGDEGVWSQGNDICTISSLPSASPSVPSFEDFVRHIHQASSKSEVQYPQDNIIMKESSVMQPITEAVKAATPSSDSLQSLVQSCYSSSSKEQAKVISGLYTVTISDSKSAEVSASVHHTAPHGTSDLYATTAVTGTMETATQQVQAHGSSLLFIPRGLSGGPQSHPLSLSSLPHEPSEVTTTDLAPELEMDMYGISYSLDEPLDH